MHVYRINQRLLQLPLEHPAIKFLRAFVACRDNCVGKEISWPKLGLVGVDQAWYSESERRMWRFSEFAYVFISFDVELDGWLNNPSTLTFSEKGTLRTLPRLRRLLSECESATSADNNKDVLEMVHEVQDLLDLWEECIRYRAQQIGVTIEDDANQE